MFYHVTKLLVSVPPREKRSRQGDVWGKLLNREDRFEEKGPDVVIIVFNSEAYMRKRKDGILSLQSKFLLINIVMEYFL